MDFAVTKGDSLMLTATSWTARFWLTLCWLLIAGCHRYHVYQIGGPLHREQGNQPGTEWREKTVHSYLWGLIRQDAPVDNCQTEVGARFGIEEIRVDTNYAYTIATAATLGFWAPVKIRWRCAKPPVSSDILSGVHND